MKVWIRRASVVGVAAVGVLGAAGAGVYGLSAMQMGRHYTIAAAAIVVPEDSAGVARGRHVALAIGKCADCHGSDLGGKVLFEDPALGVVAASNLTTGVGGIGGAYTDEDLVRAIRHGVRPDGRPLVFMPSNEFYYLDDRDLGALIAYLRSLPPVDRTLPETRIGPLARALYVAGRLDAMIPAAMIDHDAPRPRPVPPGPTAEYGEYLANAGGCKGCHGEGLSGGRIPGTPPDFPAATNLTPAGIGSWTEQDFFAAMRQGRRPDGTAIDPRMPWPYTAHLSDDELRALWLYLRAVPPRETGNR
ncbi:MAG TPA: c-type cytochrome [Longimicrobiales bacterium]